MSSNHALNQQPVIDGGIRGVIAGALTAILAFLQIEFDLISEEGALVLAPVITLAAFVIGGLYDRFVRPRLA